MSSKRGKVINAPPDAVPDSEERVYVYQKSGTDCMKELEDKRSRYMELDATLETLPQKLKHPGLIPLGPGLYAHGALVRTNEVLVLLGDSYFAEVSAHDARKIVKRRVAVLDKKVAAVEIGREEVEAVLKEPVKLPSAVPPAKKSAPKLLSGFSKGFLNKPSLSKEQIKIDQVSVSGKRPPKCPASPTSPASPATSPLVKTGSNSRSPKPVSGKKKVSFAPDTKGENKSPSATMHSLLEDFESTVKQAKKLQSESDIVNVEEEYDESGTLKCVRGASSNSSFKQPLSAPDMDEAEVNELYDMTKQPLAQKPPSTQVLPGREDYINMLLEAEHEEEEALQRENKKKDERSRRREEREFGAGLSKGFFSARSERKSAKSEVQSAEKNAAHEYFEEIDATDADNVPTVAAPTLANTVVERGTVRRRRKPAIANRGRSRASNMRTAVRVDEHQAQQVAAMMEAGEGEDEQPIRLSRFKQMRSMQKQ